MLQTGNKGGLHGVAPIHSIRSTQNHLVPVFFLYLSGNGALHQSDLLHTIDKYHQPAEEAGGRAFYVPKP
jgi:hypothetical protein